MALSDKDQRLVHLLHAGYKYPDAYNNSSPARNASRSSASVIVCKKLKDPTFANALAYLREQTARRAAISIDDVVYRLACIVMADPMDTEPWLKDGEMASVPEYARAAVSGTEETTRTAETGAVTVRRKLTREPRTPAAKLLLDVLGANSPELRKAQALEALCKELGVKDVSE